MGKLIFPSLSCAAVTTSVFAHSYDNNICKCICPSISTVMNCSHQTRFLHIANVPPNKCTCDGAILSQIADHIKGKEQEFCPRCECKYEARSTNIIKFVVIIFIWAISILVIFDVSSSEL